MVRGRRQSYMSYSVGCSVVSAAILGLLAALDEKEKLRRILPVFGGWWMGWTSATIARFVYPPPHGPPTRAGQLRSRRLERLGDRGSTRGLLPRAISTGSDWVRSGLCRHQSDTAPSAAGGHDRAARAPGREPPPVRPVVTMLRWAVDTRTRTR